MHYLTPAEQERLAYAEGYTETAAVLARLDDAHRALGDEVAMQAEIDELRTERDGLKDELDSLFTDYKNARRDMDEAHDAARRMETAVRMSLEYLTDIVEGAGSPFYNKAGAADMLRAVLLEALA